MSILALPPVLAALVVLAVPRLMRPAIVLALAVVMMGAFVPGAGLDALSQLVTIALAIIALSVLVFAAGQFAGERRARPIIAASLLVTACSIALVCARTPDMLVTWWVASSVATIALLAIAGRGISQMPARRALLAMAAPDLALIAVTAASARPHIILTVAALCACARAGLWPGRSWVSATVALPTSVSALLHAGVVNAGAILVIRLAVISGEPAWLPWALTAITLLALTARLPRIHARGDLKGTLAESTVAQMSFMLLTVALGFAPMAITHLIGHGIYKSTRFLDSGQAISSRAALRRTAPAGSRASAAHRALGIVGLLVVALVSFLVLPQGARPVLGVVTVAAAGSFWAMCERPLAQLPACWLATALVIPAYSALAAAVGVVLGASAILPAAALPWWTPAVAVITISIIDRLRRRVRRAPVATIGYLPDRASAEPMPVAA